MWACSTASNPARNLPGPALEFFRPRLKQPRREYVDAGASARSIDRPALQQLLERLTDKKDIDYVIVYKLDRWARVISTLKGFSVPSRWMVNFTLVLFCPFLQSGRSAPDWGSAEGMW